MWLRTMDRRDEMIIEEIAFCTPPDCLTNREMAVIRAYCDGHPAKGIARVLHISQKTVENHIHSVYRKLRIHDRTDLIRLGVCEGWVHLTHPHRV